MSNTNIDNKDLEKFGEFVRENKGRGNIAGLTSNSYKPEKWALAL